VEGGGEGGAPSTGVRVSWDLPVDGGEEESTPPTGAAVAGRSGGGSSGSVRRRRSSTSGWGSGTGTGLGVEEREGERSTTLPPFRRSGRRRRLELRLIGILEDLSVRSVRLERLVMAENSDASSSDVKSSS